MQACLDLGGSSIKLAVADAGHPVALDQLSGGTESHDLARALDRVRELAGGASLDSVAIAVPGLVSPDGRSLREAHGKYGWMLGFDLVQWCETELGLPARLENDARAALIGEVATGCATGTRDAVILVIGTGIGTAAMIHGVPIRGRRGSAGVLGGHVTVDRNGPVCNCGNIGCAEVYGGSWALPARIESHRLRGVQGALVSGVGFAAVVSAVTAGDPLARVVFDEAVAAWAACAVAMCHSFDPDTLILAGGVASSAELVLGPLRDYLDAHLWGALPRPELIVSTDPAHSVLRGLAALAAEMEP